MPSQFISSLQTERLSRYATVLIVLFAVAAVASVLWSNYRTSSYQPRQATPATTIDKASNKGLYQASTITAGNLFGQASRQGLDQFNLPTTLLQIQLRGAFTSTDPKSASAIIEGPDQQVHSYKVGSKVYGNAELHAVYSDRVVLSRNGELETLLFPAPSPSAEPDSGAGIEQSVAEIPADVRQLVQDNMSMKEIQQTGKEILSSAMTDQQRKELIRKRLLELRNRARQNK